MHALRLNAATTAQYREQILSAYPDGPLVVRWDRAPWHRGAAIRDLVAAHPRLALVLLRTAAPDLNPQEHGWKATRRAVSHKHTDQNFATLAPRFVTHLTTTQCARSFLDQYGWNVVCPRFN